MCIKIRTFRTFLKRKKTPLLLAGSEKACIDLPYFSVIVFEKKCFSCNNKTSCLLWLSHVKKKWLFPHVFKPRTFTEVTLIFCINADEEKTVIFKSTITIKPFRNIVIMNYRVFNSSTDNNQKTDYTTLMQKH